jgi:hypothetical protein
MTRLPRTRVAAATGVVAGTAVAVLGLVPTASAAPQPAPATTPSAPSAVAAGVPFTVTGDGCPTAGGAAPAYAVALTDVAATTDDLAVGTTGPDGGWSVTLTFPIGTAAGVHEIGAVCRTSDAGEPTEFDYPIVAVQVTGNADIRS